MTDNQSDDFAAYLADAPAPASPENILAKITAKAAELREAQEDVKRAEEALKTAQERERRLREIDLPALMDEAQQDRLTTSDGWDLERGEVLRASIPAANLPKAVAWLRANEAGGIVKRKVELEFGRGEDQKAAEAVDALKEHNFHPTDKFSVHPMTLASTVKELLEKGTEVPMELLGVYVQPVVKMKQAKARRGK